VLEAIKIFFDAQDGGALNCIFVLGMDRNVVEQGIRVRYREFALGAPAGGAQPVDARQYLDKIIQLPFNVPPLNLSQMERYIERWCRESQQNELAACAKLIATGVAPNPRSVKRTLNVLRLMVNLRKEANRAPDLDTVRRLAKIVVLQTSYDDVYRSVVVNPKELLELDAQSRKSTPPEHEALKRYPRLCAMLALPPAFPPSDADLDDLLFLARIGQ
jgi:hypothetical protein